MLYIIYLVVRIEFLINYYINYMVYRSIKGNKKDQIKNITHFKPYNVVDS